MVQNSSPYVPRVKNLHHRRSREHEAPGATEESHPLPAWREAECGWKSGSCTQGGVSGEGV